jgi:alpha-glucosidase
MTAPWWRGAIFYEIYVRSFADSNGDGIGDLPGITSRFDYLKQLGVDAVWLTPFYPSPQKDHGYDVADYYEVNPEYGTLRDFDHLVEEAHARGIRVLIDLVPNHTSDQHPWFQAALSAPDDPHRERYYFIEPKPDGTPPNNWLSGFGGSAWTREPKWGRYNLHLFAPEQPDLNWWNPAVPSEFENIVKYWFDRGADGYRIDVAVALYKRKDLADRPLVTDPITGRPKTAPGFSIIDQEEVHGVHRSWRRIAGDYEPERILLGEILEPSRQARYIRPDQLHMAFAFMQAAWEASRWKRAIDVYRRAVSRSTSLPSWTLSNHDVVRHATRFGGGATGKARARAALLLLLGLPGQYFLYQGEELGLEEVDLPEQAREDPLFIHTAGTQRGRDGCRVPIPWRRGRPNAGFSKAPPWLPMPAGWDRLAVDAQMGMASSMLAFYRSILSARRRLYSRLPARVAWERAPRDCLVYSQIEDE